MQENWLEISAQFAKRGRFVLAVIVNTQGATYRKAGTMMLINELGECTGLLSGGCLEADIALHAKSVFDGNQSKYVHYDLTADADLLWGLGLGCEGVIDILLLLLSPDNHYLAFDHVLAAVANRQTGRYWIQLPDSLSDCRTDSRTDSRIENQADSQTALAVFNPDINQLTLAIKSTNTSAQANEHANPDHKKSRWLSIPITPPIALGVVGAGPDAVPLVTMALEMGWQVQLFDHRINALAQHHAKPDSPNLQSLIKLELRADNATPDDFNGVDGVVVMTHNLTFDQQYLACLVASDVGYIGLLGPAARKQKMFKQLGFDSDELASRVFGPVGLDIGGRSPQAIALSILAQVQQQLTEKVVSHQCQIIDGMATDGLVSESLVSETLVANARVSEAGNE
ncbi:XdhC family protein [Colwellia sp. MEBiC06753]